MSGRGIQPKTEGGEEKEEEENPQSLNHKLGTTLGDARAKHLAGRRDLIH